MRLRRLTLPSRRQLATTAQYAAAGAVYIALGLADTDVIVSVFGGMAYLLAAMWIVPALVRKIR